MSVVVDSIIRRSNKDLRSLLLLFFFAFLFLPELRGQVKDPLLTRADSLQDAGELDAALPLYNQFIANHPNSIEGLYGRALLYLHRNEVEHGLADLRQAVAVDPKCAKCLVWLGKAGLLKDDPEGARDYAEKAIAADPSFAAAYHLRAGLQTSLSAALDDFNKAVDLEPKNPLYLIDRANFYLANNNRPMAFQDINSVIILDSTLGVAYYLRAYIYLDQKREGKNVAQVLENVDKAIRFGYDAADAYCLRGRMNEMLGRTDEAIADYTACADRDRTEYRALHARALLRFAKEDMNGGCEDLESELEIVGDDPNARQVVLTAWNDRCDSAALGYYYHRGIAEYNLNRYDGSIEWYNRGLARFPENVLMRVFRGNSAFQGERYDLAVRDYGDALARFDQYFQEYSQASETGTDTAEMRRLLLLDLYRSYAFAQGKAGRTDKAVALIDSAIILAQDPSPLYNQRGVLYLWDGEWKKAIKDFETALSLNPTYANALANRGMVYLLQAALKKPRPVPSLGFGVVLSERESVSSPFPVDDVQDTPDAELLKKARLDLDRVVLLDGSMAGAYELRAWARKLRGEPDYCSDLKKARELGLKSGMGLMPECD